MILSYITQIRFESRKYFSFCITISEIMNVHLLKFLLLLFFSFLWTPHAQHVKKRNSLKPGETLNSSSRLFSPNGMFVLRWSTTFVLTNGTHLCTEHVGFGTSRSYTIWFASFVITAANNSNMITLANDTGALKIRRPGAEPDEDNSVISP